MTYPLRIPTDAAVYEDKEPDVSPPREGRITDLTKTSVPLPFMLTVIAFAIAVAAGIWRIESQVTVIQTAISYERELDQQRATRQDERDTDYRRYIDQRFETLEAKIESAGLRNASMALAQELKKGR